MSLALRRGERRLLLDDSGLISTQGLRRTFHAPSRMGAVLRPAGEERALQIRSAPAWNADQRRYELWYLPHIPGIAPLAGYAESKDGLHWTRPVLRQVSVAGSLENNYARVEGLATRPECALRDPLEPDPTRRWKGLAWVPGGAQPVVSDGRVWIALPVAPISSSDEFNLSRDAATGQFIATVKTFTASGRSVAVSTSSDFLHWTRPVLTFAADAEDQERGRRAITARFADASLQHPAVNQPSAYRVDVYNMGIFRYADWFLGLPALFHQTGPTPDHNQDGFHAVQLVASRDLRTWIRIGDRRPFLAGAPSSGDAYDTVQILPPSAPVPHGNELWFYYTGLKYRDGYAEKRDWGAVCLARLRRDGFLSLDAGEEEGTMLTRPFVHPGGRLHLNLEAPNGSAAVQFCDADGNPLPGYSATLTGDRVDLPAAASGGTPSLIGKAVSLRIQMRHASLYSYWFD